MIISIGPQEVVAEKGDDKKKDNDKEKKKDNEKKNEKDDDKEDDRNDTDYENHKEKIQNLKEKIVEKVKDKFEKIKDKISEKLKKKFDKVKDKKDRKDSDKNNEEIDDEYDTVETEPEDDVQTEPEDDVQTEPEDDVQTEPVEDETENNSHTNEYTMEKKFAPSSFKGGNLIDYSPTLGKDQYGNNYVNNGFTFNDFTTDVENFKTHMPLQTLKVGESNTAVLKIYNVLGSERIKHVEIAFGLEKDRQISQSKSAIIWEQDFKGIQSLEIKDQNNMLMDVLANGKADGEIVQVTFNFAFREPMEESMVGINVWDVDRHSSTVYFNHGIEVVGESLNPPEIITILDDKGNPVKLTMEGENTAIDEKGNIWTHNSPWKKQIQPEENVPDPVGIQGFSRNHNMFDSYKDAQAQEAQQKLLELLGGRNIYNFHD